MRRFLNVTKAISDESRVRVLLALRHGELCLCQIIELLELAPSTVSKHMSILAQADLVQWRKQGRWHYYRLPGREAPPPVAATLRWLRQSLAESPTAKRDDKRLKAISRKATKDVSACYRN